MEGEFAGVGFEYDRRGPVLVVTGDFRGVGHLVARRDDVLVDHGGVGDDQLSALAGQIELQHSSGLTTVIIDSWLGHVGKRHVLVADFRGEVLVDRQTLGCDVLHIVRIGVVACCRVRNIQCDLCGINQVIRSKHILQFIFHIAFGKLLFICLRGRKASVDIILDVRIVLVLSHERADRVDHALAGDRVALHFERGG